ncbi:Transcription Factor Etv7 [Manis pentadactyla]|nr:Transcription Factor Etv7 [Manis pentadactyla]
MDLSQARQDDSGDVLLMIVMLTKTRVSGALQTCDGYGDSCVRELLSWRSGRLCQPYGFLRLPQDESGDLLLMVPEGACSRMDLLKHCRQDDSGDVLLMILLLGVEIHVSLSCFLFRRPGSREDLRHPQDDSGDLLLTIVMLIKTRVSGASSDCGMGMGIHVSGAAVLRVKLTMSRVTGGIQTADGDGDSCVLDLLPLGQEGWQPYGSLRHRPDDSGDVLLMMSGRRGSRMDLKHVKMTLVMCCS